MREVIAGVMTKNRNLDAKRLTNLLVDKMAGDENLLTGVARFAIDNVLARMQQADKLRKSTSAHVHLQNQRARVRTAPVRRCGSKC